MRLLGSDPIREHDAAIAKAEREAQAALKDVPPEVQKDFWYAANMRHNDPEGAEKLENELFEGEYADAYSDYAWAIWTLQDLLEQDNPKRTAKDLYRNTAGEIEARDAANRRHLDAGARKNRLPDTGDERTVFVEGSGRQYSINTDFAAEVDNWDGRSVKTFVVGQTSEVLKSIGAKEEQIVWHRGIIARIMREHLAIDKEVIKRIPEILENQQYARVFFSRLEL